MDESGTCPWRGCILDKDRNTKNQISREQGRIFQYKIAKLKKHLSRRRHKREWYITGAQKAKEEDGMAPFRKGV